MPMSEKSVSLLHCDVANSGLLKIDRIGSGIGVVIYDNTRHIGAGLHVLAANSGGLKPSNNFMYANTAIPQALIEIGQKGGTPPFSVAIAGGATILGGQVEQNPKKNIVVATKEALKQASLQVTLEQTGGTKMRCMVLDIDAGKIKIT
jgi:chemotaxis receptor (MCP) glutamine deamidase CheD